MKSILKVVLAILVGSSIFYLDLHAQVDQPDLFVERLKFPTGRTVSCLSNIEFRNPQPQIRIAVIVIHGYERNEEGNFGRIMDAAKGTLRDQETLVLVPNFKTAEDEPGENEHYWSNEGWASGALSDDTDIQSKRLSSYEAVDFLYKELSDRKRFPNLQRVVLVGHSAGGQFVNRYIAVGKGGDGVFGRQSPVDFRYIVANPSSYLYLDGRRPVSGSELFQVPRRVSEEYNVWRHGLEKRNAYANKIQISKIKSNVFERSAYYLIGTEDNKEDDALSKSLASMLQGDNRYDRWEKFRRYVQLFPSWKDKAQFIEIPGAGHSGRQIYDSPVCRNLIFE